MTILSSFAVGGYRSFGEVQYFEQLSKINLLVGQNNSGKSNVLRFLSEVVPTFSKSGNWNAQFIDRPVPIASKFAAGIGLPLLSKNESGDYESFEQWANKLGVNPRTALGSALFLLVRNAARENSEIVWFLFDEKGSILPQPWEGAFAALGDSDLSSLWTTLTGTSGGSRKAHWQPQVLTRITPSWPNIKVRFVPAFRQVGKEEGVDGDYSGRGIISRLAKLQNPRISEREDREKFDHIIEFVRNVVTDPDATIEIPHDRETILVRMNNRDLPIESLGTGIHEVIILAAAATLAENSILCIEEPELHLNPLLQRKLIRYLSDETSNQYFISTHSAALIDVPGATIFHTRLVDGMSVVSRVSSDGERADACFDLGYSPADLIQSNCILWVEGPSDRIYVRHWISALNADFVEGVHYSIMFYGGRLAAHVSGLEIDDPSLNDFIALRRINRRAVILIDSDKRAAQSRLNATKRRLRQEFDNGPGFAWITDGREIENYIRPDILSAAITAVHPRIKPVLPKSKFDSALRGGAELDKVAIARNIATNAEPDLDVLDLRKRIKALVDFIRQCN